jgi:hypothetical protein
MQYRRYYIRKPTISGPSYFNTSGTFTISNLPSGASVTINGGNYPLQASRSGNVITVTNPYGEAGYDALSVTFTLGSWSYTTDVFKFFYGGYVPELVEAYHTTSSYPYSDYGWCGIGTNYLHLVSDGGEGYHQCFQNMQLQGRILKTGAPVQAI